MIYNNNEQLVTELKKCFSIQDTVSETLPNKWAYHPRHSKISLTKSRALENIPYQTIYSNQAERKCYNASITTAVSSYHSGGI